ncbi:hypothetical protein LPJ59_003400 [Coemansia sp. RSA 2399]|nr:hypothetical protein LPJ59_003400 [Coemansia sp. RSA 2399]KAJ1903467.1 hypothetical protein LPJ81_003039 [Coemansia sp. IMI 209127]
MFRNVLARTSTVSRVALSQQTRNLACSTVYIKKLPRTFTKEALAPYVEKFGPVYEIDVREASPSDYYSVAFVKYYAGELPSSVDELAKLPQPLPAEIDEVLRTSNGAIHGLQNTQIDGEYLFADHTRRNKPDSIQFYARFTLGKPQGVNSMRSGSPRDRGMSAGGASIDERQNFTRGYQEGFKDGIAEGRRLSQRSD